MNRTDAAPKAKEMVPLSVIYRGIESIDQEYSYYYNSKNREVISVPDMDYGYTEIFEFDRERMQEIEEDEENRFIPMPSYRDLREYELMEDFIGEMNDKAYAELLATAIQGKGAFRRFKDMLISRGMIEEWFQYKEQFYWRVARRWCEENGIPYFDDSKKRQKP